VIWKTPTTDWVWGGPILKNNILYFGDLNGTFYALDTTNGSVKWQQQFDGAITNSPLVTDDRIYFTTEAGSIFALDLSGKTIKTTSVGEKLKLNATPVKAGDLILVAVAQTGTDQLMVAYDTDLNQQWAFVPETKK
jgi:eukaryotic-like serine/threonine-protein kinase